jgi:hypothetical protein
VCVCVCVCSKLCSSLLKWFNFERNIWICYNSLNRMQESILKNRKRIDKLINVHKIVMSSCSNMLFKVNGMPFHIDFIMLTFKNSRLFLKNISIRNLRIEEWRFCSCWKMFELSALYEKNCRTEGKDWLSVKL